MEKYPGIEETEIFKVYQRCFDERVSIHLENRFVFPDNSVGWFELSFQPVPEGLFILSMDITERKKAEERIIKLNEELEQKVADRTAALEQNIRQLKESEEKFQKAFQASAAGITMTRLADSVYVEVNDAFTHITGYTRNELTGRTSADVGLVADLKKREEVLQQIKKTGFAKNYEISVRHKSGRIIDVLSSTVTILLNDEQYAINIIYDITERKAAEQQLEAANKELEAFSYTVSHDLRAPLRAVDGYAGMLEEEFKNLLDEEGKRLLRVIQENAKRMGTLIDDLLAFSKLGRKTIQKTNVDMNLLSQEALREIRRTTQYNAEVNIGDLPEAQGDYTLICQVMINLLSNALKYSSKKADPYITVTATENNGVTTYVVKDNGDGFDMRYADKLFGVFQRLHSHEEFEGTGVGLAIVHRIVTKHEGTIWTESEPGKGATFSFTLAGTKHDRE